MRKLVVVALATAIVLATSLAVLAANGHGRTPLKCMDSLWHTTAESTSSTHFTTVPGFTDAPAAIFPIAVNVSALVSGAPVVFRVLSTNIGGQTVASNPGPTRFDPGSGANSFAYQWIEKNQSAALHGITIRLQWRSPNGSPVHLLRGDMSLLYTTDSCQGGA
jgi:hypothetical protein